MRPSPGTLRIRKVYQLHPEKRLIVLLVLGGSNDPPHHIPVSQTETADLGGGDIDVRIAGQKSVGTKKAISFPENLQGSSAETKSHLLGLGLEKPEDEIVFSESRDSRDAELFGYLFEFLGGENAEGVEVALYLREVLLLLDLSVTPVVVIVVRFRRMFRGHELFPQGAEIPSQSFKKRSIPASVRG